MELGAGSRLCSLVPPVIVSLHDNQGNENVSLRRGPAKEKGWARHPSVCDVSAGCDLAGVGRRGLRRGAGFISCGGWHGTGQWYRDGCVEAPAEASWCGG